MLRIVSWISFRIWITWLVLIRLIRAVNYWFVDVVNFQFSANLGRDGLTHNMLELIHTHWKRRRVCKVRCRGVPTVDMNNVCRHLEVNLMPDLTIVEWVQPWRYLSDSHIENNYRRRLVAKLFIESVGWSTYFEEEIIITALVRSILWCCGNLLLLYTQSSYKKHQRD